MKTKILTGFVMLAVAIMFATTGCHEKPKDLLGPEEAVTEPSEGEPSEGPIPETGKDTTPPKVSNVSPTGEGIAINTDIVVTFSEAMNPATINDKTISVFKGGTGEIEGTVSYSGVTAVFNLKNDMEKNTMYKVTVKRDVKDVAGNAMAEEYTWQFKTGGETDTEPPTINDTIPKMGEKNVSVNAAIQVIFSEPITYGDNSFSLKDKHDAPISGKATYGNNTVTFTPDSELPPRMAYIFTIKKDSISDNEGNKMVMEKDYELSFETGETPDTTKPTVKSTIPVEDATNVPKNAKVMITFSEPMLESTITTGNILLMLNDGSEHTVNGSITFDGMVAIFSPAGQFFPGEFMLRITTGVKDEAGNSMTEVHEQVFTVADIVDNEKPTVTTVDVAPTINGKVSQESVITVKFNKDMDPSTVNSGTFALVDAVVFPPTPVSPEDLGNVTYSDKVATIKPKILLTAHHTYKFEVRSDNLPKDLAGNLLDKSSSDDKIGFIVADTIGPKVESFEPENKSVNVAANTNIVITFNEDLASNTIIPDNIYLEISNNKVNAAISHQTAGGKTVVTLDPTENLTSGQSYTVYSSENVQDIYGNKGTLARAQFFIAE